MMKTTEERAATAWGDYEYREGRLYENCFCDGYLQGAIDEREELTRWHDPQDKPEANVSVLVKRNSSGLLPYDIGHIDADGHWIDSWCGSPLDDKIVGWRAIHE